MSNTHIDWSKYFDRIYCVHYLPQRERLPRLKDELKRVGILDSGVFELRYTSDSPYDEIIFKNLEYSLACVSTTNINIGLEIRRILAEAMEFGYKRILLLESDIAFLKDLAELKDALDALSPEYNIVQLDKFVNLRIAEEYRKELESATQNKWYMEVPQRAFYTSAACLSLDAVAIRSLKRILDAHIEAIDICPQIMLDCKRAIAKKNLAIQIFYEQSLNKQTAEVANIHNVYALARIDYSDYNVPQGYGYGKFMENPSANKFTVSVYAIALNEEKCVERWYNSFKEADELCVLDTGSSDKTVEILQGLGVKVTRMPFVHWNTLEEYDRLEAQGLYPWRFDRARNMAMRTCNPNSTLLFCTDIDDVVEPGWKDQLRRLWEKGCLEAQKLGRTPNGMAYDYEVDWSRYNSNSTQNFTRHNIHTPKGWIWKYPCHEVLDFKTPSPFLLSCPNFKMRSVTEVKNHKEYLLLLELNARDNKEEPRALHLLGREYLSTGQLDNAITKLEEYLNHPQSQWCCERAASMRFIAEAYHGKGDKNNRELWLWRAMAEDPKSRDYPYELGCIYVQNKKYAIAEKLLRQCVDIEKPNLEYPTFNLESFSELPYLRLAEALYYQGKCMEAASLAKKAVEINPDSQIAKTTLSEIEKYSKEMKPRKGQGKPIVLSVTV